MRNIKIWMLYVEHIDESVATSNIRCEEFSLKYVGNQKKIKSNPFVKYLLKTIFNKIICNISLVL